jgi:ketosteroid isomerase-like protein
MESRLITLTLIFSVLLINLSANSQTVTDSMLFNNLVAQYTHSIDQADTVLGSEVWSHTDEVSFINPGGNEYGWNGVKNIYNMFKENFTTRKLTFHDVKFADYGNVAWLEFYWVFEGTLKTNNSFVQTKGRETQIWRKVNQEWRLVHVHYSGMPETGQGQGF